MSVASRGRKLDELGHACLLGLLSYVILVTGVSVASGGSKLDEFGHAHLLSLVQLQG